MNLNLFKDKKDNFTFIKILILFKYSYNVKLIKLIINGNLTISSVPLFYYVINNLNYLY